MTAEPKIGAFTDAEEKALYDAIESDDYVPGESKLTPDRIKELQAAARATINEERVKISIRVPKSDLSRIKALALREGIPYQTLINAILHKAAQR